MAQYLPYFIKTCILELPIYFIFLRSSRSFFRIVVITFIVNLATHPIVFMLMPILLTKLNLNYLQYLCIAETFAPLIEALILAFYYQFSSRVSFWAALVANLFSWTVGIYWT